ncbi:serine hydrolase domain-containing protein [Tolypothrix sp. VBCCA 56010]|uniref:serine hydrolase domain-containing protein n=1 Tax=Tolypothrix sp. VBCCA 56010 TaxID=3137731 RepID=UPI003D7DBE90
MSDSTTKAPKSSLSAQQLEDFKKKFEKRMQFYMVPGASLGIVQNGKVLVSQGFGVRDLATKEPTTSKTLFTLGSITKSLTAFMVATQVDKGLYTWDTPVSEISSQYKFPPATTKQVRVRDLLGMCTGIEGALNRYANIKSEIFGANSTLWNDQSAIYTIKNIPFLPCYPGSEGEHIYNNELFASAAYLTPLKNGTSTAQLLQGYKHLMRQKVFDTIGMESTCITGILSTASRDYATSYGLDMSDGQAKTFEKGSISINFIDGIAPAGQSVSNVEDMNRYLITLLNDGVSPDGKRVVNAEILQEVWNVEGKETKTKRSDTGITGTTRYGMGWWIEEIKRKSNPAEKITVRHHGGFLPSWACMQMLVPEHNIGMVILSNGCFGRELSMEMNQELLKLLYDCDLDNFINNEALYQKFVEDLKTTIPTKVSSYTIAPENVDDVELLLGNYEGGWTLALDPDRHLVLFKDGWIYQLCPSKQDPLHIYYIGASNNHRIMQVMSADPLKPDFDVLQAAKIWFVQGAEEGVIQMIGPQVGQLNKLRNPLESPEVQIGLINLMSDKLIQKSNAFLNSFGLPNVDKSLPDKDQIVEQIKIDQLKNSLDYIDRMRRIMSEMISRFEKVPIRDRKDIYNTSIILKRMQQVIPAMESRYKKAPTSERQVIDDSNIRVLMDKTLDLLKQLDLAHENHPIAYSPEPTNEPEAAFLPKAQDVNIDISTKTTLHLIKVMQLD